FDDSYFKYAKPCLTSLKSNYPNHPPVKVLYNGNSKEVLLFIDSLPNVEMMNFEPDWKQFDNLEHEHVGSPMIYARFLLWSPDFDEFDNVVYMDCDTIVLQPFEEITTIGDFFCVSDNSEEGIFLSNYLNDPQLKGLLADQGLDLDKINVEMVNSGFFVLPKKFRTAHYREQLWSISQRYNQYIHHGDQSVISIWCHLNKFPLSTRFEYNFQTRHIFTDVVMKIQRHQIKILHYSYWKPLKNFEELVIPANHVIFVNEAFYKFVR
ncbi:MAG: glycosyltransferase, partial [Flammeovirgaceae bacterium]